MFKEIFGMNNSSYSMANTFGCKFSINQIGRHGSRIAIADVETNIAIAIYKTVLSANKWQHLSFLGFDTVCCIN